MKTINPIIISNTDREEVIKEIITKEETIITGKIIIITKKINPTTITLICMIEEGNQETQIHQT